MPGSDGKQAGARSIAPNTGSKRSSRTVDTARHERLGPGENLVAFFVVHVGGVGVRWKMGKPASCGGRHALYTAFGLECPVGSGFSA